MAFHSIPTRLAASAALALGLAAPAQAETKWIMASGYPETNFMTKNIRMFIDDVDKASGGAMTIELHPNDELIKLDAIRRAVQTGQIQIGEIRLGVYSNEDPMYELGGLPYIAGDYDSAWKLLEAQKPYFDALFEKAGFKALAYQPWPGQGFYSKVPFASTADMKGKKLRIYSKPTQKMGEMLGFEATILPFAEIPQAFATGLIEALFTSPQTGIDIQAWDNTKYFTTVGAMFTKNAIIVNLDAFKALPAEEQAALVAAGDAATKRGWEMSKGTFTEQIKVLADHGMTVSDASPEIVEKMKAIGKSMMEDWKANASPAAVEVLNTYEKNL